MEKAAKYKPWEVCVRTKVLTSESVVCEYNDSAYLSDCSSGLLSRNVFLRPLPPAWKYCLMVSRAASSTAHCFGDRFTGAAFSMSFEMSWTHTVISADLTRKVTQTQNNDDKKTQTTTTNNYNNGYISIQWNRNFRGTKVFAQMSSPTSCWSCDSYNFL